jgi:glycosyltransferase involved in cell wall biosynthesis
MRILQIHNLYRIPGGEDVVVAAEKALLEDNGHDVVLLQADNDEISGSFNQAMTAANAIYSQSGKRRVFSEIARFRPDIVHVHNFFPLWSPAVYDACRDAGVPVVQTLHNYRLFCSDAFFFRDGKVCEDCLGKFFPWPGIVHRCYRGSAVGTAAVATMLTVHRARRTWHTRVDKYIALTEFARQKYIEGGLPGEKILVKPNFVYPDPGAGSGGGGYALFVGRLSPEKGIDTLLAAWKHLDQAIPLKIVGQGPLAETVKEAVSKLSNVEWLGTLTLEKLYEIMGKAEFLIFPSAWYETFGRVAVEAFATGTPAIAAQIGAVAEIVEDQRTGLHFRPGDPDDLVAKVQWALSHPNQLQKMRREARMEFESKYTAQQNYQQLMEIYKSACNS